MKIYVITAGEYSDYHICAVTDDKKSAKNLCVKYGSWYEPIIEEYDTEYLPDRPSTYWVVKLDCARGVESCWERPFNDEEDVEINVVSFDRFCPQLTINVVAEDKDHARKIAFDKFAEWKYENAEQYHNAMESWREYSSRFPTFTSSTTLDPDSFPSAFSDAEQL